MSALTSKEWTFLDGDDVSKDINPNYLVTITQFAEYKQEQFVIRASLPQEFSIALSSAYEESIAQGLPNLVPLLGRAAGLARMTGTQLVSQAMTAQIWQGSSELSFDLPLVFQVDKSDVRDVMTPIQRLYSMVLPDAGEDGSELFRAPGPRLSADFALKASSQLGGALMNEAGKGLALAGNAALDAAKAMIGYKSDTTKQTTLKSSTNGTANVPNETRVKSATGNKDALISSIRNNISLDIGMYMRFESVVVTGVSQVHHVQPLDNGTMSRVEANVSFKTFFTPTRADLKRMFVRPIDGL